MKKCFLIIMLSLILTGCGKPQIGTYNYNPGIEYSFYLKLYNNGICEWKFGNNERLSKTADGECSYNYTDNEIIINYKTEADVYYNEETKSYTCTYKRNIIECGNRGKYTK